jgi:hypothetical protein
MTASWLGLLGAANPCMPQGAATMLLVKISLIKTRCETTT